MYNVGLAGLTYWSPNVNIFRDPRWGRGQETPGEDPLLSSKYASGYVKGLQETDGGDANRLKVAACCKHYTAYDVDNWKGIERYTFDAVVNQQDMDDTYQPPFKSCVIDGNVASVMCSYNKVNGIPTCADPDLLSGVIRGEWKLNGTTLYQDSREAAAISINAGLDLNCGSFLGQHTEAAVKAGLVNETAIDKAISNNFLTLMRLGFFDGDPKKQIYGGLGPKDVCTPANQELAAEAARQGIVLLKNTGSLPLSPTTIKTLAVIGPNANVTKTMIGNYEGTPCKYTTPLQGLAGTVSTTYLPGCSNVACAVADVDAATKLAADADATVLVIGADQSIEAESRDRVDLNLPGKQQDLVTQVAKAAKGPVLLVIMSGGGFDITFAKDDPKIAGILWVGYPGEAGGIAIAEVILAVIIQITNDVVSTILRGESTDDEHEHETRYIKRVSGSDVPVLHRRNVYAFGDGLSYTKFSHSLVKAPPRVVPLRLEENHVCRSSECQSLDALGPHCEKNAVGTAFEVHVKVRNGGDREGIHTVFLFTTPPTVHGSPRKHLLGFEKIRLGKREEAVVKFKVDVCKDLSVVDEVGKRKIGLGQHLLHVGDLKHSLSIRI
ncbi:hypothetical protein HID58_091849 [Brassica napus]|uniref:Fibronectin type III-like domain-containing protein n=1 Tax=Brassica napus TaxID=3708 RepID=A0ABQ7WYF3_BRANA|nr:hypothetical protein HID58_091849 [Brassica napus]